MDDMIERVGRALAKAENYAYDPIPYDDRARAVIEAMRDPTQAMIKDGDATPTSHSWGQSHLSAENAEFAMCEPIWQAMIDAALSRPTPEHKE